MLAIPFDAESLRHVVYVLDPHASAARLDRVYRELVALDRATTRATVLSTGGALEAAHLLKGFEAELAQFGTKKFSRGNPFARVLALRERIAALAPDELRLALDGGTTAWRIAARLAGVRRVTSDDGARTASAPVDPRTAPPRRATPAVAWSPRHLALILKSDVGRPSAHVAQALNTAVALLARGTRVTVVGPLTGGSFEDALRRCQLGAGLEASSLDRIRHVPIGEVKRSAKYAAELRAVLDRLRADGVDVLYFRQVRIASMLLPHARAIGMRVLMEAHQPYTTWAIAERGRTWGDDAGVKRYAIAMARVDRAFERRCYREVDGVVCTTRAMRRHVRRVSDVPTLLLRNGAPEPDATDDARERPAAVDVVYVGKTSLEKGTDVIVDAVARIPGATLLVAGGPTEDDLAPFRAQAERLRIADRVRFATWIPQDELFPLIRSARVAVHPLPGRGSKEWRIYTCPLKILEYMALGTPVVATDLPAVREIVRPECTGVLVPPDRPDALADAIRRVRDDRELARRLRTAAMRRVAAWSHARRAEKLFSFLASLGAPF